MGERLQPNPWPMFSVEAERDIQLTIFEGPVPKSRPKAVKYKTTLRLFNPSKWKEEGFAASVRSVMGGLLGNGTYYADDFIELSIHFRFRRPNDHFVNSKRDAAVVKEDVARFPTMSDLDNLAKFVMDALKGVLYKDDRTIVRLVVEKSWDEVPTSPGSTTIQVRVVEAR